MAAKYIVGIDLGTTNSALARCDATAAEEESRIEVRSIPQLVNPNEMAERTLLPSFIYIPGEFDFPKGSTALPWEPEPKLVIGELARKRGAESPNRSGSLRQILAFLRWGGPYCADLALAGARGGAQAIAGRSLIAVPAILAHRVGQR